ncbi:zinc finger CCCH domain-containing protein 53-like isoform X3 [Musa acuminata AAA Group]|uniref:zinc finger CCCH domain-containing protein 53-like isoform X3 n=1 Tax=Musa acuminata AAA Group TaxID=214697 RepID=UPI0031DB4981
MDAFEATQVVFSRIQSLDPENAAKVMGLLLIQDHGEELIRLAFGPDALLQSVVLKARKELGLLPPATSPSAAASATPYASLLGRQGFSARFFGGGAGPLAESSSPSWAPPSVFSRTNSNAGGAGDELQSSDELENASNPAPTQFYDGSGDGADLIDEFQLQDQLSFLNDGAATAAHGLQIGPKRDLFYQELDGNFRSPSSHGENALFPYSGGWASAAGNHRRSCSATDNYLGSEAAGLGWKPCLYFARGYCKNGNSCRFLHGQPDDSNAAMAGGGTVDAALEQQCQELLLRSKSPRQLAASAFPYSPTGSVPASPSGTNKSMNFLVQQQSESQRAMAAATAAALMLGGNGSHKFMGRPWMMEKSDFATGMANPGSRQIYLTFPADSTFREEDVSNYFSIYGPVQDVRIPYQQKRMFGFVTFVYPETVKLILAKGNPHFVCNARVLVKPYKEKGKVPDKYRKQQQPQAERGDFPGCTTPTGLDSRDPFDFPQLGSRMMFNNSINQEALLKRKLEEQKQVAELQQAIELQNRRFMGLQVLDLKNRNHFNSIATTTTNNITSLIIATTQSNGGSSTSQEEPTCQNKNSNPVAAAAAVSVAAEPLQKAAQQSAVKSQKPDSVDKGESCDGEPTCKVADIGFQQSCSSVEHNLPDSPFASPTRASSSSSSSSSTFMGPAFSAALPAEENLVEAASLFGTGNNRLISSTLFPSTTTLDMPSLNACFFHLPRLSSDQGAVGM